MCCLERVVAHVSAYHVALLNIGEPVSVAYDRGQHDPAQNLLEIDPDKFAISPSLSLLNQLGGAFHATNCRNLLSIMERGVLPGVNVEDEYHRQHESGRVHSHFYHENKSCWKKAHANGGALHPIPGSHSPRRKILRTAALSW